MLLRGFIFRCELLVLQALSFSYGAANIKPTHSGSSFDQNLFAQFSRSPLPGVLGCGGSPNHANRRSRLESKTTRDAVLQMQNHWLARIPSVSAHLGRSDRWAPGRSIPQSPNSEHERRTTDGRLAVFTLERR